MQIINTYGKKDDFIQDVVESFALVVILGLFLLYYFGFFFSGLGNTAKLLNRDSAYGGLY
jgi:hypothetical protein